MELVARSLVAGRRNKEIAYELGISPRTVETHVERLKSKLLASNRTVLVVRLVRHLVDSKAH